MDEAPFLVQNIPERIVLVVDTSCESADVASVLHEQIKAALRLFLHSKHRVACAETRYELWAVSDVSLHIASGDHAAMLAEISSLPSNAASHAGAALDMEPLTLELMRSCGGATGDAPLYANAPSTTRLVLVSTQPRSTFSTACNAHLTLLAENPLFFFDALVVVSDKDMKRGPGGTPLEAYLRSLPFYDSGRGHIHTVGWGEISDKLFERMAALVAHPLQRSSLDLIVKS